MRYTPTFPFRKEMEKIWQGREPERRERVKWKGVEAMEKIMARDAKRRERAGREQGDSGEKKSAMFIKTVWRK